MKIKNLLLLSLLLWFAALLVVPLSVSAQAPEEPNNVWNGIRTFITPIGRAFGYREGVPTDIRIIAAVVIRIFLTLLVIIFLSLIVYGGYTWMMAQGDENQVTKGKDIIRNGTVGVGIIIASYSITKFLIGALVCSVLIQSGFCLFLQGI